MFAEITRRLGLLLQGRRSNRTESEDRIFYSEPLGTGDHFIISASGGRYGGEIGRIVAEPFKQTDSCYVVDILVAREYCNRGIATTLLKLATEHSGCSTIVPIDIDPEAVKFWSHLAHKRELNVRLGLTQHELIALRYGMRPINEWKTDDAKN